MDWIVLIHTKAVCYELDRDPDTDQDVERNPLF